MEEKIKRRIEVTIAGITMSLVTDESDYFVNTVVQRMDESMSAMLNRSLKLSQLDAAMLCAIDFCGDKILAEKKVRNLEAQISLYDVNLRRLKEENISLRKQLGEESEAASKTNKDVGDCEQISISENTENTENTKSTENVHNDTGESSASSRADKLRMIEDILKK